MKRLLLIVMVLLLLSGIGVVVWTVAGLPPVRMVLHRGLRSAPTPTGRRLTVGGIEFLEVGPGCFRMGSHVNCQEGDFIGRASGLIGLQLGDVPRHWEECPVHWVEIPEPSWVAMTETTNKQYEQYEEYAHLDERSVYSPGDRDPVVAVSWPGAMRFRAWLSDHSGLNICLPAESAWECACRAGSNRDFSFGDEEGHLGEYAWYCENSDNRIHEVGTRRANAWGLHDLHGNVLEWCEDSFHMNYNGALADGTGRTEGGVEYYPGTPSRVGRGGSINLGAERCRSACRRSYSPGRRGGSVGFRPAFTLPTEE